MSDTQTISKKSTAASKPPKPVKIPRPAKFIRRPHPKTGKLPRIKVFGFAFSFEELEAWATEVNVLQNETSMNRQFGSFRTMMAQLPDSFRWGFVSPHSGEILKQCIIIGSNESQQDMVDAYNPQRVKLVQNALGTGSVGEPKWYFLREDFDYDW